MCIRDSSYGVEAIYMPELANGQEYYFAALRRLLKEGRLCPTDMVGYLSTVSYTHLALLR